MPMPSLRVPGEHPTSVNHGGDIEEEPEEHRDRLYGHTAVKFLLAGGIAGAGEAFGMHEGYLLTVSQFHGRVPLRLTVSKFS